MANCEYTASSQVALAKILIKYFIKSLAEGYQFFRKSDYKPLIDTKTIIHCLIDDEDVLVVPPGRKAPTNGKSVESSKQV